MTTKNIRVRRYTQADEEVPGAKCADGTFAWLMSIEPEDESWVMFVPKEGEPQLWIRISTLCDEAEGKVIEGYALQGSPEHEAFLANGRAPIRVSNDAAVFDQA